MGEAYRLRYTQNSYAVVSRLPEELLAEVFLYVVESGIQDNNSRFSTGTFSFLQVCKYWNKVAVGFPQLWRRWVADAVKAWSLFHSRSKDTPLSLTWRPRLANFALANINPGIPKRICQLDFDGTSEQLAQLLGAFDLNSSDVSFLRLQISPYDSREPREDLIHFLSSSFPKLSYLALVDFFSDPSSPVFTSSSLTSLKLSLPYLKETHYTLSQFSQILQQHSNLQELDLSRGAMPLPGQSSPLAHLILPRLAILRLWGSDVAILGLIDLIGLSSPLQDVVIRFGYDATRTALDVARAAKKTLVAYHGRQGLNYPREIHHLTISYNVEGQRLAFHTRSRPAPAPDLRSNFKLQFDGTSERGGEAAVKETFPLLPVGSIREFTAEGPAICGDQYSWMLQKMEDLSHLRLNKQDILPMLRAFDSDNQGLFRVIRKTTSIHPCTHR